MVTLAVCIVIFLLLFWAGTVLMWKYRFRLSRMACKQIQKPVKEDENQPLRELPYAWIILIVFVVISTLEMYFDMPSIGMAGLIWSLRLRHFNEQCEAEPKNRLHNYDRLFCTHGVHLFIYCIKRNRRPYTRTCNKRTYFGADHV